MPINLDVKPEFSDKLKVGDEIALRDGEGVLIATMKISSIYRPDKALEAKSVFGTTNAAHPGGGFLLQPTHDVSLGGNPRGVETRSHYDFKHLRDTPKEMR